MKKLIQFAVVIFVITFQVDSQEFKIGFQGGIGTYSMKGLKDINNLIMYYIPFDTKLVSDFPSYYYYRPVLMVKSTIIGIGLAYTYQSTGSRISAKDYSAEYHYDMKVNSNSPGICTEISLFTNGKVQLNMHTILGISASKLKLNEYFNLLDSTLINFDYKYEARNFFFEPGLDLSYAIKYFKIGVNFGYFLQFGDQAFYANDYINNQLIDVISSKPVKPDWNGLRIGISVMMTFDKKHD